MFHPKNHGIAVLMIKMMEACELNEKSLQTQQGYTLKKMKTDLQIDTIPLLNIIWTTTKHGYILAQQIDQTIFYMLNKKYMIDTPTIGV